MNEKKDFFISYTKHDELSAKQIAWILEKNKYTTILQSWDFKEGSNFIANMDYALVNTEKFIAVLSPDYFESEYCKAEWTVALNKDPSCSKGLFIPVRVKEFEPKGMFATILYIDLAGVESSKVEKILLDGLRSDRSRNISGIPEMLKKPRISGSFPFNNLPFRKNPNFTGRVEVFEVIYKSFKQGQYTSIVGLGGIGKTQIALEYAFRYKNIYDTIWWINADNPLTMLESYSDFAYKIGVIDKSVTERDIIREAVWNWMSQHKKWLFIFDNAEDINSIEYYLPNNNIGHILITSIEKNWSRLGKEIELDVFRPEEAVEFLVKRTGKEDGCVARLTEVLGYHPLALDQAAAYISNNKITFEGYIKLFEKYKLEIFDEDEYKSNDYRFTVSVTWNASIAKIGKESSKQFLNICSFFAPDKIDKNIFIEGNEHLPEPLSSEVKNELKYNKVILELAKYSLIKLQDNVISVHRLLQEVIRQSVKKDQWLYYCLNIMSKVFKFDYNKINSWNYFSNLVPHALLIANQSFDSTINLKEVAVLYNEAGKWLDHTAQYEEAEYIIKKAIEISENTYGKESPNTSEVYNSLAKIYYHKGNYEKSLELYNKALDISEKYLGAERRKTAIIYNNIADVYKSIGDYAKTLEWFKKALTISENELGTDYPETATTYNNIAFMYKDEGDYVKALEWFEKALAINKKLFGTEHSHTATTYNNIAFVYKDQGDYAEAQKWFKKALDIRIKVLGAKHPETAITHNNIAFVYKDQGNYTKALVCFDMALSIDIEVLGPEHPETATTYSNIAFVYKDQGDYTKALECFEKALSIREKVFGSEHSETATSLSNLAGVYKASGSYTKALEFLKNALTIREKIYGTKHLNTADTYGCIGEVYLSKDDYDNTIKLYILLYNIIVEQFGINHSRTKIVMDLLKTSYLSSGKDEKLFQNWLNVNSDCV